MNEVVYTKQSNDGTFGSTHSVNVNNPSPIKKSSSKSTNDLRIGVFPKGKKCDTYHPSKNVNSTSNKVIKQC